jgi:serpin B
MRFLVVIALCLAVASASYTNRNRFNRMLRNLQQQQQQQQPGYGNQGLNFGQDYEQDDDQNDDDEQDFYQQQQQCQRNQRYGGSLNLDNDDQQECDNNGNCDQDDENQQQDQDEYGNQQQNQNQNQNQRRNRNQQQNRQQQQQKRQQQQRHQCQPQYQLLQDLEQPNCQLASKLYKQAKQENDDKNTVVSPTAVQLALAALNRGARGNTKRQLQQLIGAGLGQQQQQHAHAALQQCLKGQGQCQQQNGQNQQAQIKTTTTIIVNQQNRAQQQFIQTVKACTNAQVKQCNFQRQPQQCRQQINRYVAQKTNQKLQHVVPQDAVTTNTKCIVVNTAQLKARWGQQFRQQQTTKQGRFYPLGSQQSKQVQVLQSQGQFNYYEDAQLQVVGVPTQNQELTMYVIVPKNKQGLTQIEKQQIQNGQQLKQLLDAADQQQEQIDIELPKFQIKHKIDAKQTCRKQGAQDAFDADEADLTNINGQQQQQQSRRQQQWANNDEDDQQQDQDNQQQQQLHVNKLIHQATIKVDEQGISAARPGRQNQQQNQYQYQNQNQDQDQDDEDDEQNQYQQNQLTSQELCESIFGQRQCQQQQQRRRQQQNQRQNQRQNQNGQTKVKVNRAFAFAIKHNQSNQIVLVGRVVDATQQPKTQQQQRQQQGQQSLNGVDQQ